jgi:hypothetical protein
MRSNDDFERSTHSEASSPSGTGSNCTRDIWALPAPQRESVPHLRESRISASRDREGHIKYEHGGYANKAADPILVD